MRHLFWVTRLFFYYFCDIFVRKKKNRSGSTSVIVVEKTATNTKRISPYGDGLACERIVDFMKEI